MNEDRAQEIADKLMLAHFSRLYKGTTGASASKWVIDAILAACTEERRAALTEAINALAEWPGQAFAQNVVVKLRDREEK